MNEIKKGEIKSLIFDGKKVPYTQFVLNSKQQVAVVGIDFRDYPGKKIDVEQQPNIRVDRLGKLSEVNTQFAIQLMNSLVGCKWNNVFYPNPEIILLTK